MTTNFEYFVHIRRYVEKFIILRDFVGTSFKVELEMFED